MIDLAKDIRKQAPELWLPLKPVQPKTTWDEPDKPPPQPTRQPSEWTYRGRR